MGVESFKRHARSTDGPPVAESMMDEVAAPQLEAGRPLHFFFETRSTGYGIHQHRIIEIVAEVIDNTETPTSSTFASYVYTTPRHMHPRGSTPKGFISVSLLVVLLL